MRPDPDPGPYSFTVSVRTEVAEFSGTNHQAKIIKGFTKILRVKVMLNCVKSRVRKCMNATLHHTPLKIYYKTSKKKTEKVKAIF